MTLPSQRFFTIRTNWTNCESVKSVNIHEAKTQFSKLIAEIEEAGEPILICRHGAPVAELGPHQRSRSVAPSARFGAVEIDYDPIEPLGESEWPNALS